MCHSVSRRPRHGRSGRGSPDRLGPGGGTTTLPGVRSPSPSDAGGEPAGDVALVVLAAGSSTRAGTETNKVLLPLAGRRVASWSLDRTESLTDIGVTVLVGRADELDTLREQIQRESPGRRFEMVAGGTTRHGSEYNALCHLRSRIVDGRIGIVVMHDSARPLAPRRLFEDVIAAARRFGAALPALSQRFLVRPDGQVPDGELVTVQTPQAFRARELLQAYDAAAVAGFDGTDTAACFEQFGAGQVRAVPGDPRNIKITFPEDIALAERLLAHRD